MTLIDGYQSFFFIGNHLIVNADLPVELAPGYFFDRASLMEICTIKNWLLKIFGGQQLIELYGTDFSGQGSINYLYDSDRVRLSADRCNFYVIRGNGLRTGVFDDLRMASHALPQQFLDSVFGHTTLSGEFDSSVHSVYADLIKFLTLPVTVDEVYFQNLKDSYRRLEFVKGKFPNIYRSVEMFDNLCTFPIKSDLFVLGLFSVIESLMTHQPDSKDPTDSLTRQIISKTILLNNRFADRLDMLAPFHSKKKGGKAKHKEIWQALYGYRSAVAHGSSIKEGDLEVIGDRSNANDFLSRFTKSLLRHALSEPVLVLDLQEC